MVSSTEDGGSLSLAPDRKTKKMSLSRPSGTADRQTMTTGTESDPLQTTSNALVDTTSGWLEAVESLIERYPWPTLLLALSLGYIISRRLR